MKQRWEATFKVIGPGEQCRWNFPASSEQCAREIAEALWWNSDWPKRYRTMLDYDLRMVPRAAAADTHDDVAPK